jgi:hypothetical protein
VAPAALQAEVFKCVSQDGKVSYSDSPCAKGVARSANISTTVGECATPECEAQRAQQVDSARRRLQEEKETLSEMVRQRRQAEADYASERARLLEAQRLAGVEEKVDALLYQGEPALYPAYPLFPAYPVYPTVLPCKGVNCFGMRRPPAGLPGPVTPGSALIRPAQIGRLDRPTATPTKPPGIQPPP